MTIFKLLLANLALINACTDSYAQPDSGGTWCSDISGVSDGQNCWGACALGCPTCSSPGCSIETRGPTTADSCFPGFSAPLCCAHVTGGGNATLTQKNYTMTMAKQVTVSIEKVAKPDACVDGGAACSAIGGTCCYSPDSTHDCCCASGSHCAVFSGTSCGAICAPGTPPTEGTLKIRQQAATLVAATVEKVAKPDACVDGGAACSAVGGTCCYSPDSTHDCCCASGSHCAVFSGTSCGAICAPGIMATTVEAVMP